MKPTEPLTLAKPVARNAWLGITLALCAVLLACFHRSLQSGQILFSSDGPLGALAAAYAEMPGAYRGMWQDLNWVGSYMGSAFPSMTYLLLWLLGPLWFAKLLAPVSLFILGLSAWVFFRQLGLRPVVCLLGGLAAALNSDFFSYACWGLGTTVLAVASTFLALAALVTPATRRDWLKAVLAGAAVGMAVMEGFDSGAILSLYVAAFAIFQSWLRPGRTAQRLLGGLTRTAVVAVSAAFVAAQVLTILIGTQIQGVVGMEQDPRTKAQRWDQATMWSLPKTETIRAVIPGLFGYRMQTYDGSDYWGRVGETPGVPGTRHSGAGHYAGLLVVLLAFGALARSLRRQGSPFTELERRAVWFWGVAALVSLMLAWGRHAPFYQFFYALPYASTIRNPIKFLHPFSLSLVILFAYGAEALWRSQVDRAVAKAATFGARFKSWWAAAPAFDRRSVLGLVFVLGGSLLAWLLYASSRRGLEAHLAQSVSPRELAPAIAAFSLAEFGWYVLLLALGVALLILVFSGFFAGPKARWAGICLGLFVAVDLGRANVPWVQYWDFSDKYSLNPVVDTLRREAEEHRVAVLPLDQPREMLYLQQFYRADWLQHAFRYYNIQSLDDVQDPRPSADKASYLGTFYARQLAGFMRLWELTSTRYVLGLAGLADRLNQQVDPVRKPFREALPFGLAQEPSSGAVRVVTNTPGPFALLEFTTALPRAKLYDHWEVSTNAGQTLERLADPAFDPARTVLLASSEGLAAAPGSATTNAASGSVEFVSYAPKRVVLKAQTSGPAVLLHNDGYDPHWTVTVDGASQPLLRANFLMRAVALPAGEHTVEFTFRVSRRPQLVSLAGLLISAGLLGWLWVEQRTKLAGTPRG